MTRLSWPNVVAYPTLHGQQCKEQLLWWPGSEVVAGRCHATQQQWFVHFAWGTDPPSATSPPDSTGAYYPRTDIAYPFQYVYSPREPALYPAPTHFSFGYNYEAPFRYLTAHWFSPAYGTPDGPLFQLNWALYYGGSDLCFTANPLTQPAPDKIPTLFDHDSLGHQHTGGSINDPPTASGWLLVLLQSRIRAADPNDSNSPIGQYCRPLLMYTLDLDDPTPTQFTTFRGQEPNKFLLVHNPVGFPNHYAVLYPVPALSSRPM